MFSQFRPQGGEGGCARQRGHVWQRGACMIGGVAGGIFVAWQGVAGGGWGSGTCVVKVGHAWQG